MPLELPLKYYPGSKISHLNLDAHIINSFNARGETITLSASKEDVEKF